MGVLQVSNIKLLSDMPVSIISFDKALQFAGQKRHLLLGNGFSISWKPDIFRYDSLYNRANFKNLNSNVKTVFEKLATTDFELVMKALQSAAKVLKVYSPDSKSLIKELETDAAELKNLLVNTIASNHPVNPNELSESEYFHANAFLDLFQNIYTLNYDLLLYWVIMHYNEKTRKVKYDDGFRTPDSGQAEYVTWDIEKTNKQNIFYLHGALHIFDEGSELQKYTWVNTGIKLITQIKTALDKDFFPVFVSEGTSKEKKEKIVHSNYLSRGYRSFAAITNSLFIYGHSLAVNDDHILNLIPKGKISNLFVSIYGDINTPDNKKIIRKAHALQQTRRNDKVPLELYFYDASSVKIWR
jgi:hypothetical protein